MSVSRLSKTSVQNAFQKYNTIWDGTTSTSAFDSITTVTVVSATGTITFSSIPQTYTHLQIRGVGRMNYSLAQAGLGIYFNGDTSTSYRNHFLVGTGSGTASSSEDGATNTPYPYQLPAASAPSGTFGPVIMDILDYSSTSKNKVLRGLGGGDRNGSGQVYLSSAAWFNTAAITSITLTTGSTQLITNSTFALYGIK